MENKKLTKAQAEEKIQEFFQNIQDKTPEEIRKIKKLAMHYNIKLGALRKRFCKKCYSPNLKIKSIKNKIKTIECRNCQAIFRWKIK